MTTPHQPTRTARVPFWVFTLLPLMLVTLLTIWACDDFNVADGESGTACDVDGSSTSSDSSDEGCECDDDCDSDELCVDGECAEACGDTTCEESAYCTPTDKCVYCPDGYFYNNKEFYTLHPDEWCIKGSGQFCDASFGDDLCVPGVDGIIPTCFPRSEMT